MNNVQRSGAPPSSALRWGLVFLGIALLNSMNLRGELIVGAGETEIDAKENAGRLYKVGIEQRKFIPAGPYNWRGAQTHALLVTIWYPADSGAEEQMQWIGPAEAPLFNAGKAIPDAKVA